MVCYRIRISVSKSHDNYRTDDTKRYDMDLEANYKNGEEIAEDELKSAANLMLDKLVELGQRIESDSYECNCD